MKEQFFDLMAGEDNPRNSEGAFIQLKNGEILFVYSRYSGDSADDNASADLGACNSRDGGRTWLDRGIAVSRRDADNIMSVSLLRLQNGRIMMVYLVLCKAYTKDVYSIPVCCFSDDDGKTWSKPEYVTDRKEYFVVNNDRMIQLQSGRLLMPAACHGILEHGIAPGIIELFYSDDNGMTWQKSPAKLVPPQGMKSGFQEPGVIELEPDKILLWTRTDAGYQYKSFSEDGGISFTKPVPAKEFVSPCSPLSMKRKPDGKLLAVWNDHPSAREWFRRTPLVMAESADNAQTWSKHMVLGDDPARGYCYTAILFLKDALLLGYCFGKNEGKHCCLQDLRIHRIEW